MTIFFTHAGKELFGRVVRWDGKIPTVLTPYGLMITVKGVWNKDKPPKQERKVRKRPQKEREGAKSPTWSEKIGGNYRQMPGTLVAVVAEDKAKEIQDYFQAKRAASIEKADKHAVKVPKRHTNRLAKTVNSPRKIAERLLRMELEDALKD